MSEFITVESYGDNGCCFLDEGELSQTSDSQYKRKTGQEVPSNEEG